MAPAQEVVVSIVRMGRCASCGTEVLWLRAWGFGEPRPLELRPDPAGEVVIDPVEARHRAAPAGVTDLHRYRLHWPCPSVTPPHPHDAPAPATAPVIAAIVPHTHWDREWYVPFQTFRLRLVRVLDGVLDLLEADPSFSHFLLDGQTAMVDDYLEVRPEAEGRIRDQAAAGRLALGPWHTQPDEFLVSGETLVRNLQRGLARSAELGGTMHVGYLPDSFGHAAQMPQLLRLAGIGHAVVFRGVPDSVESTAFWWEAPDGSQVRAEHLALGYTNAFRLPDDPAGLVARAADLDATLAGRRVGGLLLMNGGDHQPPLAWLGHVVAGANAGGRYHFTITGLEPYLDGQPVEGLPVWRGELRASGPSTVTMGVTSNRVDVRQAAAAAERAVERRGEPLSALLLPTDRYPTRLLDLAWRRLLDNAAHDSACATSADEVVDQVLVRYAEARQLGDGLAAEAVAALAASVDAPAGSVVVVNAGGHKRAGMIRLQVPGRGPLHLVAPDGTTVPAQVLSTSQPVEMTAGAGDVVADLFGPGTFAGHPVARWSDGLVLEMAAPEEPTVDLAEALARLGAGGVTLLRPPVRDVVAMAGPVAGFGWAAHVVVEGDGPLSTVASGDGWIANEQLRVDVDAGDGTLTVTTADGMRVAGLNRYVDGGDAGDTYNWSPPADDRLVDHPDAVRVELIESGPVRARLAVTAAYSWAEVTTTVDVVTGEPFVRIEVAFVNARTDHRLRAHFPLPAPATGADADCAFAVVHRGLTHDGNPIEAGLPTYPARRFVDAGDLALIHDGVGEYELVDGGRELALTLLRTVGFLSREDGRLRPVHAGPVLATPRAEQLGPFRRAYAIALHRGANLHALADDVLLPLEHAPVDASSRRTPAAGAGLTVEGAEVTAVLRDHGALVVRMFRAGDEPGWVSMARNGASVQGWLVDLTGRPLAEVAGGLALGPWQIATVRLDGS
jgi:mannosylglycerate hydrolase